MARECPVCAGIPEIDLDDDGNPVLCSYCDGSGRVSEQAWLDYANEREAEARELQRDCGDAAEWDSPGVRK